MHISWLVLQLLNDMHANSPTILCVDDEEPGLEMRRILLESAGYRVVTARSGREGIRIFNSEKIDAVILDYWMAGMNGIAVARQLKHSNPAMPIIMLSAYGTILDEALGVADVWIRKGEEDPQYLLARLKEMIESRSQKWTIQTARWSEKPIMKEQFYILELDEEFIINSITDRGAKVVKRGYYSRDEALKAFPQAA